MKVAAMWSGGKDSSLATYDAVMQGLEVSDLVNYSYKGTAQPNPNMPNNPLSRIFNTVGRASPSIISNLASVIYHKDLSTMIPHEVAPEIIQKQAQAIEMPLVQGEVRWDTIDQFLKTSIRSLKKKGIEGIVFGVVPPHFPLDTTEKLREYQTLVAHKDWMNRICRELDVKPITPLWESNPDQILEDLIAKGFESIILVVDSKYFGAEWLGQKIDKDFLNAVYKLKREKSVHIGGSGYHTLVLDGPLFKKRLKIQKSRKIWKRGYGVLEIDELDLVAK
ncbi:MAG: Dph6-related ATP pyrophosphatase [Candidatus Bathyarchaeia archaeon]